MYAAPLFDLNAQKPLIIAGPCSAESRQQLLSTCCALAATGHVGALRAGIWKPRTRPGNFEGAGVKGLVWLMEARAKTGLPVAVEVATTVHVEAALKAGVDILWVGARSTGNPFSVQEIAEALRGVQTTVLVKNPPVPDVNLWLGSVQRLQKVGLTNLGLIHRGFPTFGSSYRNDPMWHVAIEMKRLAPELVMLCDPSHICGDRVRLQSIAQQSADLNYNGLLIESHIAPDTALSDARQQITPEVLRELLDAITWRSESIDKPEFLLSLESLRGEIDQLDSEIVALLSRRMCVAEEIGRIKKENQVSILQRVRWDDIVETIMKRSDELGLSPVFLKTFLDALHLESIRKQDQVMNK